MSKVNSILTERLKQESRPKMADLAKKSSTGALTSFSGIFGVAELTESENEELKALLERFALDETQDNLSDFKQLAAITTEVKAINNQAAILHGERIKKAQTLLKPYKDGAFTAWLITVYGNRQTPYNFLQYYEFHEIVSKELKPLIDAMPRQAVYTLAARDGSIEKKEELIRISEGKSKQELLELIREFFPLAENDGRLRDPYSTLMSSLQKISPLVETHKLTRKQKEEVLEFIESIRSSLMKGGRR